MKFLLLIGTFLTLQSCATIGKPFFFSGPEEIKIGKTTQANVLRRFGTPFRVGYDSGKIQWTYAHYKYNAFTKTDTKDLVITFSKDRTVKAYVYNSSLEEDKMKLMIK